MSVALPDCSGFVINWTFLLVIFCFQQLKEKTWFDHCSFAFLFGHICVSCILHYCKFWLCAMTCIIERGVGVSQRLVRLCLIFWARWLFLLSHITGFWLYKVSYGKHITGPFLTRPDNTIYFYTTIEKRSFSHLALKSNLGLRLWLTEGKFKERFFFSKCSIKSLIFSPCQCDFMMHSLSVQCDEWRMKKFELLPK